MPKNPGIRKTRQPAKKPRMRPNSAFTRQLAIRRNRIYKLKMLGLKDSVIATELGLTEKTIKRHLNELKGSAKTKAKIEKLSRKGGYWPPAPPGVYATPKQRIRGARIARAARLITTHPDIAAQRYARARDKPELMERVRIRKHAEETQYKALSGGRPFTYSAERAIVQEQKLPTRQMHPEQRRGKTGMQFIKASVRERQIVKAQDIRGMHAEIRHLKENLNLLGEIEGVPSGHELSGKIIMRMRDRGLQASREKLNISSERALINQRISALKKRISDLRPVLGVRARRLEQRRAEGVPEKPKGFSRAIEPTPLELRVRKKLPSHEIVAATLGPEKGLEKRRYYDFEQKGGGKDYELEHRRNQANAKRASEQAQANGTRKRGKLFHRKKKK